MGDWNTNFNIFTMFFLSFRLLSFKRNGKRTSQNDIFRPDFRIRDLSARFLLGQLMGNCLLGFLLSNFRPHNRLRFSLWHTSNFTKSLQNCFIKSSRDMFN